MTTPAKSKFQGVTQLRTSLHGPLAKAQDEKDQIAFNLHALVVYSEQEPFPVEFHATLDKYNIQGVAERAFLADLAKNSGWHDIFLWTVIAASWQYPPGHPLFLTDLEKALDFVKTTMRQNGLVSTNGIPSTPRKGWVYSNVSNALSKDFKRGMDQPERSNHHER